MVKCAVFASGGGSNFQALIDRKLAGDLHVDFALLVGNNSKSGAFERARKNNIPTLHISPGHFTSDAEYASRLMGELTARQVDVIALAGYMKQLPPSLISAYRHRILNIHPALLPAFGGKGMYGHFVHEAVIASGAKIDGVTIHFVDEEYDSGPIVFQAALPVRDSDTPESLANRILALEHDSYWRALDLVACNKVRVEGKRVLVI
jgi:formyltetrahydrofolate-dependent phosphoribosylglycinamide formyltransferase